VILDYNKFQLDDATKVICNLDPLTDKWKSFNWHVQEIDGHNFDPIIKAIETAQKVKDQPAVIICHTIKGKGVSFMEGDRKWHGKAPNAEELTQALEELGI
jgi:transketolase